jgi:hypothetical protein
MILSFFYGTSTASGNPNQISKDLMYGASVDFNNLTSSTFSTIGVGLLPVELTSFHVYVKSGVAMLRWITATETNNHGFAIERTTDSRNWNEIAFVAGSGSSSVERRYAYMDAAFPPDATELSYRLRQIDRDGTTEYSPVVTLRLQNHVIAAITDAYPNPFNPTTTVRFSLKEETVASLTITDVSGRSVKTILHGAAMNSGAHAVTVHADDLPSGRYFLVLQTASEQSMYPVVLTK